MIVQPEDTKESRESSFFRGVYADAGPGRGMTWIDDAPAEKVIR